MPSANEIMSGLTSVISAVDTYSSRIAESNPVNKILTSYDAYLGAVAQGKEGIRNYLPSEGIDSLTNDINKQFEACVKLEGSPLKQAKMRFAAANLEASLKGFELPLEKNTAFDNLSYAGLEEKEVLEKAIPAVKEAIIKLNGETVSREKYAEAVINEALNNLKKDPKISAELLKKYENFITQGDKSKKFVNGEFQPAVIPGKTDQLAEEAIKAANKAKEAMNKNVIEAEQVTIENPYAVIDNKLNTNDSKLANDNLKIKIEQYFAPLLESNNPALVNGTKKVLSELNPGYLTEHGWGESIALELQRVAKPKLWQRIVAVFTGTDYAQKNIDKAVANFKESNSRHIYMKNLPEELKKEEQAPNKEINIVTAKKEQGKEQNKTISQSYESSISTPISHVDKLNKSKESGQQSGHSK
ncbi:hypothetical protein H6P87_00642 [Rickettsia tillamookensis]|uniref:NAD/GMP synthase domain-containing protein n=1 Tax=Rickettsia tillamookensis TaxID=2761623 RepID=A0A9E6MHW9_9RICK|nr:hypothetical protein [Rickettsia tillamookensis]QQV75097.1 hypothetical protein H6P87_00642 [Rickettsia tillamookensis]